MFRFHSSGSGVIEIILSRRWEDREKRVTEVFSVKKKKKKLLKRVTLALLNGWTAKVKRVCGQEPDTTHFWLCREEKREKRHPAQISHLWPNVPLECAIGGVLLLRNDTDKSSKKQQSVDRGGNLLAQSGDSSATQAVIKFRCLSQWYNITHHTILCCSTFITTLLLL